MKFIAFLAICLTLLAIGGALSPSTRSDPYVLGELPVNYTEFLSPLTLFLDTNIDVYAPNAPGTFPVLYLITGFGGVIPGFFYKQFLTHIASHGFVAVGVWQLSSPVASFNATWMDHTIQFVERRLQNSLIRNHGYDPNFIIDYQNAFIAGHSSGAHVPIAQLQAHCLNFRGQILLSPVDGADPFGYVPIAVITPGEKVNFTIPTLEAIVGFDSVPSSLGVACAPPDLSGYRFFDAMTGPTWMINVTAFGHADLLDEGYGELIEVTQFCVTPLGINKDPYRRYMAGTLISFMRGVLDPIESCYLLDNLEMDGILGLETTHDFQANGWQRCAPTQCTPH